MARCPTCKSAVPDDLPSPPFPFCSQRCKLVDLHGWLNGRYVISDALPFEEGDSSVRDDDD
jgi:endogenous inhibitor of DNA gyrase (YacG/DUF329 family)